MQLTVSHEFLPKRPSLNAAVVMGQFGVAFETGRHVIAERLDLPIQPGDVVCFTGASGAGKSSLMRAAAAELRRRGRKVVELDAPDLLPASGATLVDALSLPIDEALRLLASCGLGEARLMLRSPQELSDGQRYRFRLALGLARRPDWIVADEFTATLDRTLARVIGRNVRRTADRTGTGFLLATTHEDILHDLQPSRHVRCRLDGRIEQYGSPRPEEPDGGGRQHGAVKKKRRASPMSSRLPPVPVRTGRTSLGGITGAIASPPCGS